MSWHGISRTEYDMDRFVERWRVIDFAQLEAEKDAREFEEASGPRCFYCGGNCSGDVTTQIDMIGEMSICDEPDECPSN